ncbi:hypothetical protein ACFC26_37050 [Kitasatospora purpeofusca]|uniref:hypothetical protein n=1 Tax=Kitasatospora purpeofusca TaxID=67352 RepID=UPI0035DE3923
MPDDLIERRAMDRTPGWARTVRELADRLELAQAAWAEAETEAERPSGNSPQDKARSSQALLAALALSRARDAALLYAAGSALQRRADGRSAPLRLPRGRVLPSAVTPRWWCMAVTRDDAGIWRSIPQIGPETRVGLSADNPLVLEAAEQARLLQASLRGHRTHDDHYEAYVPGGGLDRIGEGRSAPPPAWLGPKTGRKVHAYVHSTLGTRVRADRTDEFDQASRDRHAVWERSRAYGSAVVELLRRAG